MWPELGVEECKREVGQGCFVAAGAYELYMAFGLDIAHTGSGIDIVCGSQDCCNYAKLLIADQRRIG